MTEYLGLIEKRLEELSSANDGLSESMRYSLLAGGKRIRPILALEFCNICGGDVRKALDAACAIEMVHTYSLIHDDLPCMDNDDLRRGKPTNHVVYGECTATLAGDALQAYAFETIFESSLSDSVKAKCALALSKAIGPSGMCYGQYLDMIGEGKKLSTEELDFINYHKTGDLIAASCMIGCICAEASDDIIAEAGDFGYKIGLAFQIRDDMLDVISSSEELGKPVGSDADENKNTYMELLGEKLCADKVEELTSSAINILHTFFKNSENLEFLAKQLESRTK